MIQPGKIMVRAVNRLCDCRTIDSARRVKNVCRPESVQIGENNILPGASAGHRRRVDEPNITKRRGRAAISNRESKRLEMRPYGNAQKTGEKSKSAPPKSVAIRTEADPLF
jgi:hypothetical protein